MSAQLGLNIDPPYCTVYNMVLCLQGGGDTDPDPIQRSGIRLGSARIQFVQGASIRLWFQMVDGGGYTLHYTRGRI